MYNKDSDLFFKMQIDHYLILIYFKPPRPNETCQWFRIQRLMQVY